MITAVLGVLAALTICFAIVFIKDVVKHKNNLESNSWVKVSAIGFITNFFDTLGIGSFAPTTALLKAFKQTKDRVIPGTLNVACTIPVVAEAFIFMTVIKVEPITLIGMLAAAALGAWVGAGIVSKLPERIIQFTMGVALFITAFLMFASKVGWMPGGGDAIGLEGGKLIFAIVANFVLGALMTAGIGLYAPCMALVYFLGMSPNIAFPIMMGSCAFLMPVASIKFVKEGAYDRKASLGITIGGAIGVFIAAYIVKSLPLNILGWLVIGVILYTSITMLKSASKAHSKSGVAIE
ncbi:sulfite exporter TauE/SafE family protein [Alkaliphilus sp. MSJ-5]|uniref:Probable membrane transporter protein n=1 Tax=Alkaliphilus flagellatus TaxID=2841507 RepID=A0ABS6G923_9FIRM|nr:sulfite exporter TauE/SafE family protein [Alkaliphilus flagellatus]MBU5678212.1 sulfite exporter TauE/SafE family protein [Alkaliphilus flagellatus]